MKINPLKYILVLTAGFAVSTNLVFAQQVRNTKRKAPNISVNITSNKDSIKTSHFNVGLLTNISNLKGVSINAISSVVKNDMTGIQASGLINIDGFNSKGLMIGGLANIVGHESSGVMIGGLMNVSGKTANGLQASLFGNIVGKRSNGVTIGGLVNVSGKEMNGINIAGIANVSGKSQKGLLLGGLMNASAESTNAFQIASIINIVGKEAKGLQLSALSNVSVDVKGIQATGLTNIAAGKMNGLQISSAVNIAVAAKGLQFAPGNYTGELKGVQLGILNMSEGSGNGLQIGIINHSKDSTTHKIGLVNITPKTRIQMMAFTSNTSKFNIAARFKNRKTYSIIGAGTHYLGLNEKFSGTIFYRTGLYYPIAKNLELSGDLGFYHIESFDNQDENTPKRMYSLQGRVNLEYQLLRRLSIFASGGYGTTRYYDKNKFYEKKPIFALGVVLF